MRKSRLLASATAVALLVAGCGKAEQQAAPPQTTTAAPTPAEAVAFTSLAELSKAVDTGSSAAKSARMSFSGSDGTDKLSGEGAFDFAGESTAMAMTMTTPADGTMEMRLVDQVAYIKGGEELEPGKPWLKLDLAGDNPMAEALGGVLEQLEQTDPRRSLRDIISIGELTGSGPDVIDGAPVTRYEIAVDVAKFAEQRGASPDEIAEIAKLPTKTITYTAFLDADDLPRRLVIEMPRPGSATMSITVDYTDWGKPVTVEAPPAAEVAELPES